MKCPQRIRVDLRPSVVNFPSVVWDKRLLTLTEMEPLSASGWPALLDVFMAHQQQSWPLLKEGLDGLSHVQVKELVLDRTRIVAQHNPRRLTSTTAAVDDKARKQRRCFLCPDGLPPEEKGLPYGGEFVILCNPFPILPGHLTIVHRDHRPQALAGVFDVLLDLAHDLAPDYFVLYNGAKCGASAPDHLHFQAARRGKLPIEEYLGGPYDTTIAGDVTVVSRLVHYPALVLLLRSSDRGEMHRWFDRLLDCLRGSTETEGEPLVNLIVTDDHRPIGETTSCQWTVILFPRSRHRPACFYAQGEAQLLISPAAIDLAGLVVIPRREDFEKITPDIIKEIFAEVTLPTEHFHAVSKCLTQSFTL